VAAVAAPPTGSVPATPSAQPAVPPAPVQAGAATVEADEIAYDPATRVVTARGRVRVTHPRFRLFADLLTFDLERQVITAEGRVRVIERGGRELRGRSIVYDVTRETGMISDAETIVGQLYLHGETIQVSPERLVVEEATATPCDPRAPLYRVTARRIEVIPGDVAIARDASLWLGSIRLITLGEYRISLRPGGRPGEGLTRGIVPGVGYNQTDGLWLNLRYPYRLGSFGGEVYAKYGQYTGLFALNTLEHDRPGWSLTLRVGRTQNQEPVTGILRAFSQAEAVAAMTPRPLAGTRLLLSGALGAGWFHETDTALGTTRLEGTITLATEALRLGRRLTAFASTSGRFSAYGTRQQRQVLTAAAALSYQLDDLTNLTLRHDLVVQRGATPFLFDGVTPASTSSATLSRYAGEFRLQAGVSHNFLVPETKLLAGVGTRLSPSLYLDLDVIYNLRTRAMEDIDYVLTYRCDCLRALVRYRQIRSEFSIEVSLPLSDRLAFTQPAP
jgi:hypothetical protein